VQAQRLVNEIRAKLRPLEEQIRNRVHQEVDVLCRPGEAGLDDRHPTDDDVLCALSVQVLAEGYEIAEACGAGFERRAIISIDHASASSNVRNL
jgi:hypothetical protein